MTTGRSIGRACSQNGAALKALGPAASRANATCTQPHVPGLQAATTIYQERKAELDAVYDRFDLEEIDGGERWRCKTCGAHGETWKTMPGLYDYPHTIGTAAHRNPTCERTSA
ncbi:hypothetical protein ACWD3J_16390 [Streptomyces sp. NPDC002755]